LLVLNEGLALELGIDPDALRTSQAVATLVGNVTPEGATPAAQAYAGHQFGWFSPSLGDGRPSCSASCSTSGARAVTCT